MEAKKASPGSRAKVCSAMPIGWASRLGDARSRGCRSKDGLEAGVQGCGDLGSLLFLGWRGRFSLD